MIGSEVWKVAWVDNGAETLLSLWAGGGSGLTLRLLARRERVQLQRCAPPPRAAQSREARCAGCEGAWA